MPLYMKMSQKISTSITSKISYFSIEGTSIKFIS